MARIERRYAALHCILVALCAPVAGAAQGGAYLYGWFDPQVIYNDGRTKTVLQVATRGEDVRTVEQRGARGAWLRLFDDGTHGDRVAGDGVFTRNQLSSASLNVAIPPQWFGGTHYWFADSLRIRRANGGVETRYGPSLAVVDRRQVFPAVRLGPGVVATSHAVGIVDPTGELLGGKIPLGKIRCGDVTFGVFAKLYSILPDVFDFVVVMPAGTIFDPTRGYVENVPYAVPVKNEVQGIGLAVFDDTARFFSAGRLRAMIFHSFDYGAILDHEIGHAWSAWSFGGDLDIADGSHWLETTDVAGQMSKFIITPRRTGHLVANQDGSWRIVPEDAATETFSWLDLYLMGLAPPGKVPPVHKLVDPDYSNPDRVTARGVETYSIEQLMAASGGPRVPATWSAPKSFTIAFVMVKNKAFTPAELAWMSLVAQYFTSRAPGEHHLTPFATATRGRGVLDARLPLP